MKTLGLIGGVSWVSTAGYYKNINEGINQKRGGIHFAECIIHSFNFHDIINNNNNNDWESTFEMLSKACENLKRSGAEAILLCANTLHLLADRIEEQVGLPVIHIATETATEIKKQNLSTVGLLGTKFTMELDFFTSKLAKKNIETLVPELEDRDFIQNAIYNELGSGIINPETKDRFVKIINKLIKNGAEGIIFGCTEIPLLIKEEDCAVPVFDTLLIHSRAAVDFALR
jgi:aspartate racemase